MAASSYEVIYPSAGRILLDGGKNNKFERSIILDNESPDCANVIFSNGDVATRGGVTKLNTAAVGSFVCDGIYTRRTNTSSETMVAFFGGTMWQLATTTFSTISSAQSVFTAGVRVAATQYQNHMFLSNGANIPYKYNGTDFTRHGVYAPTTTMAVASGAAGNLAGTYSWKVNYVNSQSVEGDVSPAVTFTVTSTGGQVSITSIPVAPQSFGVASRRIYRTNAGGTTYFRVTEIANNTTTTFTDNVASSAVGATAPTDNGVPPAFNACIYHANRVFINDTAHPNFVWYSELAEPYTYPTTNFLLFGDNAADLVKGFAIFDKSLVVYCENSIWLVYMADTDPANWSTVQVRSAVGSKSAFGAAKFDNKVLFPAMQNSKFVGYAAVNGDSLEPSATMLTISAMGSDMQSDRVEPDMFLIQEGFAANISSITFKNKVYSSVTYGNNNTVNNRIYVFDFSISNLGRKVPAWVPYTGISAAQFTIYGGSLYFGSSLADGFVHQMETTSYNDNGSAIDSYIWTKEFSGYKGQENMQKDFRRSNILLDKAGAYYMELRYRVDSDKGSGTQILINLDPGSATWNAFNWGGALWGSGAEQEDFTTYIAPGTGKRIQLKFSNRNMANQRFKIHGLNYTYNLRGTR